MNDQLQNALAQLATKLGTSAEHLWPVLVAYERASALTWVIVGVTMFLICATISTLAYRKWIQAVAKPFRERTCDEDNVVAASFGVMAVAAIVGLMFLLGNVQNVARFISPEAAALHSLIHGE